MKNLNIAEKRIIQAITQEDWDMVVRDKYPLQRLGELEYLYANLDLNEAYDLDKVLEYLFKNN